MHGMYNIMISAMYLLQCGYSMRLSGYDW